MASPFLPIAEDLEWLRTDWCSGSRPSTAAIRRGSAALRQLLCQAMIQQAWRYHGLQGAPMVTAPDLLALATYCNHELRHAASVIAGGAHIGGVQYLLVGAWRTDNPTTGVSADADEGFAVIVGSVMRDVRGVTEDNELTPLAEREWRIGQYLNAPGAVRRGQPISRRLIVEFFANYAGGVHLDRATGHANAEKRALYELVAELEERVTVDEVEGLYFEILAIGQALGRSSSLQRLTVAIRADQRPQEVLPQS